MVLLDVGKVVEHDVVSRCCVGAGGEAFQFVQTVRQSGFVQLEGFVPSQRSYFHETTVAGGFQIYPYNTVAEQPPNGIETGGRLRRCTRTPAPHSRVDYHTRR